MRDYRTTTRFAAQGLTELARDGLERARRADEAAARNARELASREVELAENGPVRVLTEELAWHSWVRP